MRSTSAIVLSVAFLAGLAAAWPNTPPLPERIVGLGEGAGKKNIDIEIHYDLMCEVSAALHPDFATFLDTPFLDGKVRDFISARYVFQPLPYHHASWIPHKILPYVSDQCFSNPNATCQYINYMNFCFNNQDAILGSTDKTYNQIIQMWTGMVSKQFGFPQKDLVALYDWDTDVNDTEDRARYMWKYSTFKGVESTPSAFVNGIMVQLYPGSPDDWMQILKDVFSG